MSTLIDIKEASKILDLTPQQVRNLCRDEKIASKKLGGSWHLYEESTYEYYDKTSCGVAEDRDKFTVITKKVKKKPIALSFFSGAMGLDIGLEQAGFEVLLCSEIDNACRKTIIKNKPEIALIGDIRDYTVDEIRKKAGLINSDEIDLIVGGPPCQAFSTAGKRKSFNDERGNVFLNYIDLAIKLNPKYFVIENVRGLLSAPINHIPHKERVQSNVIIAEQQKGSALFYVLNKIKNSGYSVSFNLYNSANFGTPQKRERVIIICSRTGKKMPYLIPTHSENGEYGLPKWNTFEKAIKELNVSTHNFIKFPDKRLKYYKLLKAGQNWKNLPDNLQKEALGASYYAGGGKTGFLRRIAWNEPSPTLVTHPAMPATDLAHPVENRPLSVEEYKCLQEFPDTWIIEGSLIEKYRQIGNAVPISLGKAVGVLLIKDMKNEKIKSFQGFNYSRYKNTDDVSWENDYISKTSTLFPE